MKNIILIFLSLIFLVNVNSCSSESNKFHPDLMDEMHVCHENSNYDSTTILSALVGTYDWRYVRVAMSSYESDEDYNGWMLQLNNDGSFELNQNDTNTVLGNWFIEKSLASFQINTQPTIESVWGEILICDSYLMFFNSPLDGPDHLYQKR
jgi:hypothetical protein